MPASGRYATAALFVLLGVVLLAFTTGYVDSATVWDVAIPGVFVLLGLWALAASRLRNLTGPVLVVAVAGAVLLSNLGVLPPGFLGRWWPLVFVLFGVLVLVSRERRHRRADYVEGSEDVTLVSVFGGADRRVGSQRFAGADVVSVFGGPTLDLRDAAVAAPPATIEVVSVFGGAEITVPEGWDVRVDVFPLFGGVSDERSHGAGKETPDLVVTGVVLFGGVEVRD